MKRKMILLIIAALLIMTLPGVSRATDEDLWTTSVNPDALIVLDLSGSMAWLPNGSNPTFYACGSTCAEPYYVNPIISGTPSTLYTIAGNCSSDGPYTITQAAGADMPTSNLWVAGTNCSIDGPFSLTAGSSALNVGNDVYISSSSSCGYDGPFYRNYSWNPNHRKSCNVATRLPDTVYTATDCTNGPFYKTSGSGHTTACYKYRQCTSFSPGYTETDCNNGPFYRTSGSGHTTLCMTSATCTTPATVYTETDCATGPFYNSSGSGHTTICRNCTKACTVSGTSYKYSDTSSCDGPFYDDSNSGVRTDCSKIKIAKRALFELFDGTGDDSISSTDVTSLGMRLGFMRYYNCSSSNNNYAYTNSSACIKLSWGITENDYTTTTPYANIYCNDATCASTVTSCTTSSPQNECVAGYSTSGGTPFGYSIREGRSYLDYHKALDTASTCRQKSLIVITDGEDTYACNGNGSDSGTNQRRSPIYYAKQAADANFKVYIVGFGADMPETLKDTLNWTAYYGGTRNPNETQTGDTSTVTVGTDPCSNGTDPSGHNLRGYAFMASNPQELVSSIRTALTMIQEATYSFSSQASVAAARVQEENYIYEASFEPKNSVGINKEPFWTGHLKKYQIGDDGALITPHCWDAGVTLQGMSADDRNMLTYKSALTAFNTTNITAADLAVASDTRRNEVVGFYRGEATYNLENWKLGDLFHTNPIIVKTPNQFFSDPRECGSTSFSAFRSANTRTAANGNQLILAGANDGQLHAFHTGSSTDCTSGGDELWSFIPPNLLQKISPIAHNIHSTDIDVRNTLAAHDFFIDGPLQVADVWLPSADSSGTSKSASDWKTIAIFGEGQGSGAYLWSPSSTCYSTSAFSATYSATTPYYCGIYALNVTNTSAASPTYMWHLMPASAQAPYLGEAWSKAQVGRVKIAGDEKWVAFIGGGYNGSSCLSVDGATSTACNTPATGSAGKGFFVVDLRNGSILWSFTHADNNSMDFSVPASPYPVDVDNDGFIDTVYMGDLGGNMWRFRLCSKDACASCGLASYTSSPCTSCSTSSWSGSRLFSSTNTERGSSLSTPVNTHKQIFTMATATKDTLGNVWVYFGTGESNDPASKPTDTSVTKNRLYGIKEDLDAVSVDGDAEFTHTYTTSDLINVTSSTTSECTRGWYYNLSTNALTRSDGTTFSSPVGEKMISDPTIFGGIVYFATYLPNQAIGDSCGLAGDSFLYKIKYLCPTAEGDITTQYIGHGQASSVLVSYRPGYTAADIYITASGGAGTAALTQDVGQAPITSSMTNILYWKDRRLQ